jgi:hypothetical protein
VHAPDAELVIAARELTPTSASLQHAPGVRSRRIVGGGGRLERVRAIEAAPRLVLGRLDVRADDASVAQGWCALKPGHAVRRDGGQSGGAACVPREADDRAAFRALLLRSPVQMHVSACA